MRSIKIKEMHTLLTIDTLLEWQAINEILAVYYVPFCAGAADNFYYICLDEANYSKVYYIEHEFLNDFLVAPEIKGFIPNGFTEF